LLIYYNLLLLTLYYISFRRAMICRIEGIIMTVL